jgi:hypothetical protein
MEVLAGAAASIAGLDFSKNLSYFAVCRERERHRGARSHKGSRVLLIDRLSDPGGMGVRACSSLVCHHWHGQDVQQHASASL